MFVEFGKLDDQFLDALVKRLEDTSENIRVKAAELLGKHGKRDASIINGLLKSLNTGENHSRIREAAAFSLAQLGHVEDRVIDGLVELLSSISILDDPEKKKVFIQINRHDARLVDRLFSEIECETGFPAIGIARALIRFQKADERVRDALICWVQDENNDIHVGAGVVLCELAQTDAQVVDTLLIVLQHTNPQVRDHIVYLLGEIGKEDRHIVDALLPLLGHQDYNTRARAAYTLGQIGKDNTRVIDAILRRLQQETEAGIRYEIVRALGKIRGDDDGVRESLLSFLEDKDARVELETAKVLIQYDKLDSRTLNKLADLLQYQGEFIRYEAAGVLIGIDKIQEKIVKSLLVFLEDEKDFRVAWILRELEVRTYFTRAIQTEDESIVNLLLNACQSENPNLRSICAYAFGQSGRTEFADQLVQMLEEPRNAESFEMTYPSRRRNVTVRETSFEGLWQLIVGNSGSGLST